MRSILTGLVATCAERFHSTPESTRLTRPHALSNQDETKVTGVGGVVPEAVA